MKKFWRSKNLALFLAIVTLTSAMLVGCQAISDKVVSYLEADPLQVVQQIEEAKSRVTEDGTYTSKLEVAAYIQKYDHLPSNFITKQEARELGWDSNAGNLHEVAPGKSIGGDQFIPNAKVSKKISNKDGIIYYECDINYTQGIRGQERIVYSNTNLMYYSPDHYKTFEVLCGVE